MSAQSLLYMHYTKFGVCALFSHHRYGSSVFHTGPPVGFALAEPGGTLQKPPLFPSYVGGIHQYDPAASFSGEMRQHSFCEHEPNCVRFHR